MHKLSTICNTTIALSVVLGAVITNNGDALIAVIVNGMAQAGITGSAMWANAKEHQAKVDK